MVQSTSSDFPVDYKDKTPVKWEALRERWIKEISEIREFVSALSVRKIETTQTDIDSWNEEWNSWNNRRRWNEAEQTHTHYIVMGITPKEHLPLS